MNRSDLLALLFSTTTIRQRCLMIYEHVLSGASPYFTLNLENIDKAVDLVVDVIYENYPNLDIPYHSRWRHFEGEASTSYQRFQNLLPTEPLAKGQTLFDLVILSVLLDAGAGPAWSYREPDSGQELKSSEGLAIASLNLVLAGFFSSNSQQPLRVDADKILSQSFQDFCGMMQHSPKNSLLAIDSRWQLLQQLAKVMQTQPSVFGEGSSARLGCFFDHILALTREGSIAAPQILTEVLTIFGPIWPGRLEIAGFNLGDCWLHRAVQGVNPTLNIVPFHKLSQWLTYSLLEPLEGYGIKIDAIDALTGLPEYRNGGLFLDTGVIAMKSSELQHRLLSASDEALVEWRALTVILLDEIAKHIQTRLQLTAQFMPLAKVLQGGTWAAGRKLAKEKRNGAPPLAIKLEGTVF